MKLSDKRLCTGCYACRSICPVFCISMEQDKEGFFYPAVDEEKCINCKECERTCPVIVQSNERKPLQVYAAKNPNEEIRRRSSSGGIFTLLSEHIINKGGVAFGVRFSDVWEVMHDYTETMEGLAAFRGSKYVQSKIGSTYTIAKDFLTTGRNVLFSGTPCQIAGLKAFLQKNYSNLLTVDFVCHGAPSPLVWEKYLDELVMCLSTKNKVAISNIKFRDKRYGWKRYCMMVKFLLSDSNGKTSLLVEPLDKNVFLKGFLSDLYLRPSCYTCPIKSFKSGSDITIGDYWGVEYILPKFDDDKGVSLVMINTEKGKEIYGVLNKIDQSTTYAEAFAGNAAIEKSATLPAKRTVFFERWLDEPVISLIDKLTVISLQIRLKQTIIVLLRRFGILPMVKSLLKKWKGST